MNEEMYQPGDPVADILFNWSPLIGAVLACLFGIILLQQGFRAYVKAARLKKSGVRGHAIITRKWMKKGYVDRDERHLSKPTKYHFLQFERSDSGRNFSEKEVAPIDVWSEVELGDQVEVIYLQGSSLMRLAAWPDLLGHSAGLVQLAAGSVLVAVSSGMLISGAFAAVRNPEYRSIGADWLSAQAEVLNIGIPADPYIRLFAPDKKYIQVVFGDTQGGALMANQQVILLSPEQFSGRDISVGNVIKAWMDPGNEYNAVLDIERDLSLH